MYGIFNKEEFELLNQVISKIQIQAFPYLNKYDYFSLDEETFKHSFRVGVLAVMIGYELHMNEEILKQLYLAGLLHDVGKGQLNKDILHKKILSKKEFQYIKTHPVIGYEILKNKGFGGMILDAALHHHEKLDGTGYPDGTINIKPTTQIITASDIFEAGVSNRCYKKSKTPEEIIVEMYSDEGINQDIIDIILELYRKKYINWLNV